MNFTENSKGTIVSELQHISQFNMAPQCGIFCFHFSLSNIAIETPSMIKITY